ncbi:MAG: hypothetical protein J6Y20_07190 [Lachnospiraceae bacterium]|nr:hypothetical protein [Lachnospiraceae bacterium]
MTTYNWLSLFGVPAIILAIFTATYKRLSTRQKKEASENAAIKAGIQALLRDRLYEIYRECKQRGGASRFDRENFNNIYTQYHSLGANGVMDDIRDKLFKMKVLED